MTERPENESSDDYTSSEDGVEEDQDDSPHPPLLSRSDKAYTEAWSDGLRTCPDDKTISYRVEAIVQTIEEILSRFPGENILVTLETIKFLDILHEALRRREISRVGIIEFNGTIISRQERARILGDFNQRGEGPAILLISYNSGGTGLNITGASFWERQEAPVDDREGLPDTPASASPYIRVYIDISRYRYAYGWSIYGKGWG